MSGSGSCRILLLLISCLRVFAGPSYVGSAVCGRCHEAQFEKQSASHHAAALRPVSAMPAFTAPGVKWAFGAGVQGVTPVGVGEDGVYFEGRYSFYPRVGRTGLTFGHPTVATDPRGVRLDNKTAEKCFGCHSTTSAEMGVRCERCHGPGSAHAASALKKDIQNPGRLSARAQVEMCGQCHRLPTEPSPEPEIEDPVSVRFAPVGLMASRCFQASGSLRCTTCHDPHADGATPQCVGCHASAASSKCPRTADCVGCHMKKASVGEFLRFTDHRIRVY